MLASFLTAVLLGASLSSSAPLNPRTVTLDPAATAEAQKRDDTATRAFTAIPITTSTGLRFHVDPLSGDFRENLTPVQLLPCNGTANQQWDVITAGVHNNVAGTALIVSSLTNACLNFDPRRAAGNQVLLFSCGGRADGGGTVTNSQQFPFVGGNVIPLLPLNGNNATCLTSGTGSLLGQTSCNAASPSANELFTLGGSGTAVSPPPAAETTSTSASKLTSAGPTATSPPKSASPTSTSTQTVTSVSGAGGVLNPSAAAEANPRDNTATRAFSAAQIKTSTGQCLDIDPLSGDFRENLIPIQIKDCDGSPNQQWDVITAGVHNNVAGTALIVSTLTNGCLNFDPRRAAGNQVLLFSCGGRADGGGTVTNSQQFKFAGIPSGAVPLTPLNGNNAVCLTSSGSLLDQATCNPSSPSATELFTISGGSSVKPPATTSTVASITVTPAVDAETPPPTTTVSATTTTATVITVAGAGGVLNPTAAAEANPRDNTAVRTFTAAQIKTSSGSCLHIDPTAGDFRENLIPVQIKTCDGSANQQFDVITSGVHNNVPGAALIVSSLTNGCLNFDPRRAAGDQTILFSCGGRADGGGTVTNSQLFNFDVSKTTNVALLPQNGISGTNAVCLTASGAVLDNEACTVGSASGSELFSFVQ